MSMTAQSPTESWPLPSFTEQIHWIMVCSIFAHKFTSINPNHINFPKVEIFYTFIWLIELQKFA